jgi:hypothetical protein
MTSTMTSKTKYFCEICDKYYSSYKSVWYHNSKFHKNIDVKIKKVFLNKTNAIPSDSAVNPPKCISNNLTCQYCYKVFSRIDNLKRHNNICKNKTITNKKSIENEISEIKKEISELKELLQNALKVHPRTLHKINKQLNNTNNGTITNNTMQIIQLGKENLGQVLTEQDKLKILNRQGMSINDLVELIHTSDKYNQFKNILITNLQSSFCYKYDDKMMSFIAVNKDELLNDILEARIYDINTFYDELRHLMNPKKAETLERFLDKMDDIDGKMRNIKKEEIKLILYNNRNKIKENQKVIEL